MGLFNFIYTDTYFIPLLTLFRTSISNSIHAMRIQKHLHLNTKSIHVTEKLKLKIVFQHLDCLLPWIFFPCKHTADIFSICYTACNRCNLWNTNIWGEHYLPHQQVSDIALVFQYTPHQHPPRKTSWKNQWNFASTAFKNIFSRIKHILNTKLVDIFFRYTDRQI